MKKTNKYPEIANDKTARENTAKFMKNSNLSITEKEVCDIKTITEYIHHTINNLDGMVLNNNVYVLDSGMCEATNLDFKIDINNLYEAQQKEFIHKLKMVIAEKCLSFCNIDYAFGNGHLFLSFVWI